VVRGDIDPFDVSPRDGDGTVSGGGYRFPPEVIHQAIGPGALLSGEARHIGALSSATWADVDQTIESRIIPLDSLSQNVLLGVVLVSANSLVPACLNWLPMADDSLHVAMFLRLGRVRDSD
jgi:hypothetical protein